MMKIAGIAGIVLVVLLTGAETVSAANLVLNGDFETPVANYPYSTLYPGNGLTGWTIESGSVDLIHGYWQPHTGSQSIDLAGYSAAKISQIIETEPGATYDLTFWMAGNPELQGPKVLGVSWDKAELSPPITFDTSGKSKQNMGWTFIKIPGLTATRPTTELAFEHKTPPGVYGVVLDDICLYKPLPVIPLTGAENPPNDLDCDGIYEDINGNGRLDFADVVLFFNQMTWIVANEPIAAFDLNGNGRIDFADIVALFNEI
jgi:choice-of-anchor C domain-containing protein